MGNTSSSTSAYQIIKVNENSEAHRKGLIPFIHFIIAIEEKECQRETRDGGDNNDVLNEDNVKEGNSNNLDKDIDSYNCNETDLLKVITLFDAYKKKEFSITIPSTQQLGIKVHPSPKFLPIYKITNPVQKGLAHLLNLNNNYLLGIEDYYSEPGCLLDDIREINVAEENNELESDSNKKEGFVLIVYDPEMEMVRRVFVKKGCMLGCEVMSGIFYSIPEGREMKMVFMEETNDAVGDLENKQDDNQPVSGDFSPTNSEKNKKLEVSLNFEDHKNDFSRKASECEEAPPFSDDPSKKAFIEELELGKTGGDIDLVLDEIDIKDQCNEALKISRGSPKYNADEMDNDKHANDKYNNDKHDNDKRINDKCNNDNCDNDKHVNDKFNNDKHTNDCNFIRNDTDSNNLINNNKYPDDTGICKYDEHHIDSKKHHSNSSAGDTVYQQIKGIDTPNFQYDANATDLDKEVQSDPNGFENKINSESFSFNDVINEFIDEFDTKDFAVRDSKNGETSESKVAVNDKESVSFSNANIGDINVDGDFNEELILNNGNSVIYQDESGISLEVDLSVLGSNEKNNPENDKDGSIFNDNINEDTTANGEKGKHFNEYPRVGYEFNEDIKGDNHFNGIDREIGNFKDEDKKLLHYNDHVVGVNCNDHVIAVNCNDQTIGVNCNDHVIGKNTQDAYKNDNEAENSECFENEENLEEMPVDSFFDEVPDEFFK